jgi:hypothetical protein
MSLEKLLNLPLEERCASLLRHDSESFESALLPLDSLRGAARMDAHRLAWAVAFNIDGLSVPRTANSGPLRSGHGYRDHWPAETSWTVVWSALIRPQPQEDLSHSSNLLSELALSVACERREDWQIPTARPIDPAITDLAFESVYARNRMKVLGVCSRFAAQVSESEAIAAEAWSRVFCNYWSIHASRRFLGLSRISTLVCQVARYIAIVWGGNYRVT